MAMSKEHKAALAEGRRESRAIRAYLRAVNTPKRRGRPVTKEGLQARIAELDKRIAASTDPLSQVDLIQRRIDLSAEVGSLDSPVDLASLEARFVESAAGYSDRKGISYSAWREAGVSAATLKKAGIRRTRG